jgi:hypothetical protein
MDLLNANLGNLHSASYITDKIFGFAIQNPIMNLSSWFDWSTLWVRETNLWIALLNTYNSTFRAHILYMQVVVLINFRVFKMSYLRNNKDYLFK